MVKCQWTTVVLLSESAKEQSAQTTDRLDLCALHIVYGYIYMCILYIHIVYLYIIYIYKIMSSKAFIEM